MVSRKTPVSLAEETVGRRLGRGKEVKDHRETTIRKPAGTISWKKDQ
jgi:hypothetical protein